MFSDWLFCSACRLSTVRVTPADFSGAFNPTQVYLFQLYNSNIYLIRSETCASLDMNGITIEKGLEKYIEHLYF